MAALAPAKRSSYTTQAAAWALPQHSLRGCAARRVIGTASAFKHDALRSFGVDHAIDYRHANVADEVKKITRGRGVDVILDPIGGRSFTDSYRMLAPLGRLIIFGLSAAAPGEKRSTWRAFRAWLSTPRFNPMSMINRNRGVFGLHIGHLWDERRQLAPLMDDVDQRAGAGRLTPVVARTFPLERAADAHRFIQSRANIGKVVLTTK